MAIKLVLACPASIKHTQKRYGKALEKKRKLFKPNPKDS